jgi:hypothetical protein
MEMDEEVWNHAVFSKNRERLRSEEIRKPWTNQQYQTIFVSTIRLAVFLEVNAQNFISKTPLVGSPGHQRLVQ